MEFLIGLLIAGAIGGGLGYIGRLGDRKSVVRLEDHSTSIEESSISIEENTDKRLLSTKEKLEEFKNRDNPEYVLRKLQEKRMFSGVGTIVDEKKAYELQQQGYGLDEMTAKGSKYKQYVIISVPEE